MSTSASSSQSRPAEGELLARIKTAREERTLDTRRVEVQFTSEEEAADLQRQARELNAGEDKVTVTLELSPELVDKLRLIAQLQGRGGYKELIQEWIDLELEGALDRLEAEEGVVPGGRDGL